MSHSRTVAGVFFAAALAGPAAAWSPSELFGDALGEWDIRGTNTARIEYYENHGDTSQSPYPHEGRQLYDEFDISFARRFSRYENVFAHVSGVLNDSEYRAPDEGIVPERMSLRWEKGDAAVPFRAEFGDYYGYLSYRTLQRSLKGVQVDLQPSFDAASTMRHSILLLAGMDQPFWREVNVDENAYLAASWLVEDPKLGRFSANTVHNTRSTAAGDLEQWVQTFAGEHEFRFDRHRLTVEGELGYFNGEHTTPGDDESGIGWFLEARGQHGRQFTYRLRHEDYDGDYRPTGAVISYDRRSNEAHVGWRFNQGLQLRGRWQQWIDFNDSADSQTTDTIGLNLTGPFGAGLTGSLQAFRQEIDNDTNTVQRDTDSVQLDLARAFGGGWLGRLALLYQDVDDRTATNADSETRQVHVSASHAVRYGRVTGQFTPGLLYRDVDATTGDSEDWNPTLNLQLAAGAHSLGVSYGYLSQNRDASGDLVTQTAALDYRFTTGPHTFGVEANLFDRWIDGPADVDAWRVGLFWTFRFDKPALGAARPGALAATFAPSTGALPDGVRLLAGLAPGERMARATGRLTEAGYGAPLELVDAVTYDAVVLPAIDQRQRLVLERRGPIVERSALVIDLDPNGGPDNAAQTFERVRETLIETYGRPGRTLDDGEFSAEFVADVNAGRLTRVSDWNFADGVLRLGIPRRLDGAVRIEVQHARSLPPPTEPLWSIESVP
ncbi:MAG: hypothetical protein KDG50_00430 [Chromatiales bacterium]|nr:hypothetical protein [Chromatiales bacterium]